MELRPAGCLDLLPPSSGVLPSPPLPSLPTPFPDTLAACTADVTTENSSSKFRRRDVQYYTTCSPLATEQPESGQIACPGKTARRVTGFRNIPNYQLPRERESKRRAAPPGRCSCRHCRVAAAFVVADREFIVCVLISPRRAAPRRARSAHSSSSRLTWSTYMHTYVQTDEHAGGGNAPGRREHLRLTYI